MCAPIRVGQATERELIRFIAQPQVAMPVEVSKHIERRHFYIRECVENMQITVPYVNTLDNLADFFTKPLKPPQFFAMRDQIMNAPRSHNPLR